MHLGCIALSKSMLFSPMERLSSKSLERSHVGI